MAKAKKAPLKPIAVPYGMVALCDYAAKGELNKHTLVNIYSGDVLVAEFPAQLHFGFYAELKPSSPLIKDADVHITFAGNAIGTLKMNFAQATPERGSLVLLPAFGFVAGQEGDLEFAVDAEGYAKTVLMKKRISVSEQLTALANASQPPSSQSRSASSEKEPSPEQRRPSSPRRGRRRSVQ